MKIIEGWSGRLPRTTVAAKSFSMRFVFNAIDIIIIIVITVIIAVIKIIITIIVIID